MEVKQSFKRHRVLIDGKSEKLEALTVAQLNRVAAQYPSFFITTKDNQSGRNPIKITVQRKSRKK